jgi:hypothetical protein
MNWQHEKDMREEKNMSTKLIAQNRISSVMVAQKRSNIEVKRNESFQYLSHTKSMMCHDVAIQPLSNKYAFRSKYMHIYYIQIVY